MADALGSGPSEGNFIGVQVPFWADSIRLYSTMNPFFSAQNKTQTSEKKVILTGASGLIGREAVKPLEEAGFKVYALDSKNTDLFDYDAVDSFLKKINAQYLLHFAWITDGDYLENPVNLKYKEASLNLLSSFKKYGGKRAVMAGTCFEYAFKNSLLKETDLIKPKSLYAECKTELFNRSLEYCRKNNLSLGWGRIFYVFGNNENPKRLTGTLINSFKANKKVIINTGELIRDYMYAKDIAAAFVKLLESNAEGAVNICTGKGVTLKEFAQTFARILKKENLLEIRNDKTSQPPFIAGDNTRLKKEAGYSPRYTLEEAVWEIVREVP